MPRASANKPTFNFSTGKVTEASPLTFPENSAKILNNMDINLDGTVRRRFGLDYEDSFSETNIGSLTDVITEATSTFVWKTVSGEGGLDFYVVQRGYVLDFYMLGSAILSTSKVGSIDLIGQALPGTSVRNLTRMQFSSGRGVLFVAENTLKTCFIEYDSSNSTFTLTSIDIELRDFEGVEDGLGIRDRISTLSPLHEYNIKNQGWYPDTVLVFNVGLENPIGNFKTSGGLYPSNADLLSSGMVAVQLDGAPAYIYDGNVSGLEGNTRAPRGHYILNAFEKDRSLASGISGIPSSPVTSRPGSTAFFAGRVWFAGTPNSELGGTLFFSQLLTDLSKVGKCYQEQDPTAIELNALLATDGGVIEIPEVGKVLKILPFGKALLVFATNGIWTIDGGFDSGFDAENFSISKVSNVDTISSTTIVETDVGIFFWSASGIYRISTGEVQGLQVDSVSESTIQTDYLAIADNLKKVATSFYDRASNKIYWLYKSGTIGNTLQSYQYSYDKAIVLNLKLGAFTDYTFSSSSTSPVVLDVVSSEGAITIQVSENVTDNGEIVTADGEDVTALFPQTIAGAPNLKLLTLSPSGSNVTVTFSEFNNRNFSDWETALGTGLDSPAEILTGYELLGDSSRDKQIDYFTMHFERTEQNFILSGTDLVLDFPSSCNVQTRWEWTGTSNAGRWSTSFEAYRLNRFYIPAGPEPFDYSFDVVTTKSKIRGHGRAINFDMTSSPGNDMRVLGWDVLYSGNTRV